MPEVISPNVAGSEADPWWQPLSPHPEQAYGLETFPVDPDRLARSQDGVRALKGRHDEDNDSRNYAWRLGLSSATGLPASLRTLQTLPDDDEVAQKSIFSASGLTLALFGTPESPLVADELIPGPILRLNDPRGADASHQARHFTWRQVYRGWPVIGGSVRAHAWTGDRRVLFTSSYFPVPDQPPPTEIPPNDAMLEARSLRAYMRVAPWTDALAALARVIDLYPPVSDDQIERLLKLLDAEQPSRVLDAARAWLAAGDKPQPQITARPTPIYGAPSCIMPFGGSYHFARRYLVAGPKGDPWYVDIDAVTGEVLGGAWQAAVAAPSYYRTSGETLAGAPAGDLPSLVGPALGNWLSSIFSNGATLLSGNADDQTVAASAWKMKEHLVSVCGVPRAQLEPANQPLIVEPHSLDRTGFAYDDFRPRKLIRFEKDPGTGIAEDHNVVYTPARDPEVVMHECVHAFLWLIDPASWDTSPTLNPFARALHEGYAMYLSRSAGANPSDVPGLSEEDEVWARGSYTRKKHDNTSTDNWLDRWLFVRAGQAVGADLLPAPNIYPTGAYSAREILVYDAGMVWARALWDLRRLIGRDEADWLIVQAYPYLHGYIANFSLAAEAILDVDARRTSVNLSNGIQPVWATRNIVVDSAVRGFAETTTGRLIARTPSGILIWDPANGQWQAETANLPGGETLTGIVAVTADGDTLYAAAELPPASVSGQGARWRPGIYAWTAASGVWTPRGDDWIGDTGGRSPLCLLVPQPSQLLAGTSRGVYAYDAANRRWMAFGGGDNAFAALQLTANGGDVAAVSPQDLYYLTGNGWGRADVAVFGGAFNTLRLTGLATLPGNGTIYVGSLAGLWQVAASAKTLAGPAASAVLAMRAGANTLYYSTPDGVRALDAAGADHLAGQQGLPGGALVVSVFERPSGEVLAGTAAHGIWQCTGQPKIWSQMPMPVAPAGLSASAGERLLVSLAHPGKAGVQVVDGNPQVDVQEVSRPGFPLQTIMPSAGGGYDVETGPLILRLGAVGAGAVQVRVNANGDIVLN